MKEIRRKLKQFEYAASFLTFMQLNRSLAKVKLGAQSFSSMHCQETLIWGCNQVDICHNREGKPNHTGNGGRTFFVQFLSSVGLKPKLLVVAIGNYFICKGVYI